MTGSESPAETRDHLFLMDRLLEFIGTDERLSRAVYRQGWFSRVARMTSAIYSWRFLPRIPGSDAGSFLLRGQSVSVVRGKVLLTDTRIAAKAMRCFDLARPFVIGRTREREPVRRACERLGIDRADDLACYLSGNLLIFFAKKDGRRVVVHLASYAEGYKDIESHRVGLEVAREALQSHPALRLLPGVLGSSAQGRYEVLTQTLMPGVAQLFEGASTDDFYRVIDRAFEPLAELRATVEVCDAGPDWALIFEIFPATLEHFSELRETLAPLLKGMQRWQQARGLQPILTHGDYWPRNILVDEANGDVTGVIDWESVRRHGTPGLDALQLVVYTAVEFGREMTEFFAQAWTGEWEDPRLAAYVLRLRECFGLDETDVGFLAAMLCFDELEKIRAKGRSDAVNLTAKLQELSPVISAWLANGAL